MTDWVFLLHQLPRYPSAPRLALWRALRRLGAVVVADGLAALPAEARTIEHMQWLAAEVAERGGRGSVWLARPTTRGEGAELEVQARDSVEGEYRGLLSDIAAAQLEPAQARRRTVRRLRRRLRAIDGRDFFGAPSAKSAGQALEALVVADQNAVTA
jgi:hypothetical protein